MKILYFICLLFSIYSFSQNEFKIIQSNTLESQKNNNENIQFLYGNVIVEHKKHILYCDTMLISQKNDFVKAWSHDKILIKDTNNLTINSKEVSFFKQDSIINFQHDVFCKKGDSKIYTNNLKYNLKEKIAYYEEGGRIEDEDIVLKSEKCKYELNTKNANFSQNVNLKNKEYLILSQNLNFNKNKEKIIFNERSEIIKDSLKILGDYGFYNQKNKHLELFNNVIVEKNNKMNILSNKLIDKNDISIFTDNPKIIINSKNENFVIKGDEIVINNNDSILSIFHNVNIYNDSIKGECSTSFYNFKNEKISLIDKPVLWVNKQQITGDTIFLYTKNENLDSIYIPQNSFIMSKKNEKYYNQIKGKSLYGKFEKNKIKHVHIIGNSILKYFNEKDNVINASNDIISNNMKIYFKNSEIFKIYFNGEPEANYTPIDLIKEEDVYLNGFLIRKKPSDN